MEAHEGIRTFADAVAAVGVGSPLLAEWGMTVGDRGSTTGLTAFAELRVICAAMGGGGRRPGGGAFLPTFCVFGEDEICGASAASEETVRGEGWRLSDGRWLYCNGSSSGCGCAVAELTLPTRAAAGWCGSRFIGWWAAYLLGRELAGPEWRADLLRSDGEAIGGRGAR